MFWVNNDIDRHIVVTKDSTITNIGRRPDSGDLCWGIEYGVSNLTSYHIDLVTIGHRDQHVCVFGTSLAHHVRVRRHACNGSNIYSVLQLPQTRAICINDGDITCFQAKVLSEITAYFTRAENNYFHSGSLLNLA